MSTATDIGGKDIERELAAIMAGDDDEAGHVCTHAAMIVAAGDTTTPLYILGNSGPARAWMVCRACAVADIELRHADARSHNRGCAAA